VSYLPEPVARERDAGAAGDAGVFLGWFRPDDAVDGRGREFNGPGEIRAWIRS
jgi:hypothetical protein